MNGMLVETVSVELVLSDRSIGADIVRSYVASTLSVFVLNAPPRVKEKAMNWRARGVE